MPVWYRDLNGSTRALDPTDCFQPTRPRPARSCRSAARQSVIKYFFRHVIDKNSQTTVDDVVADILAALSCAWSVRGRQDEGFDCCKPDGSNWLPPALNTPYQTVQADQVLQSLTGQLQSFYRRALEDPSVWTHYLDQSTLDAYNWTADPTGAAIAQREALLRKDQPTVRYDSTEARSPPGLFESRIARIARRQKAAIRAESRGAQ